MAELPANLKINASPGWWGVKTPLSRVASILGANFNVEVNPTTHNTGAVILRISHDLKTSEHANNAQESLRVQAVLKQLNTSFASSSKLEGIKFGLQGNQIVATESKMPGKEMRKLAGDLAVLAQLTASQLREIKFSQTPAATTAPAEAPSTADDKGSALPGAAAKLLAGGQVGAGKRALGDGGRGGGS